MKIISKAPTRIGLIGGGTDVNPFASEHGGKVLSFAINLHHVTTLIPNKSDFIFIKALGMEENFKLSDKINYDIKELAIIKVIINHFKNKIKTGFSLEVKFTGYSPSGLGTSASAAVSIIGAFDYWLQTRLSKMEITMLAHHLENDELGWITGKQDQLAAVYGGINILNFGPGEKISVKPAHLSSSMIKDMKDRSLMIFASKRKLSGEVQKGLIKNMNDDEKIKILFALKEGVNLAYKCIIDSDYKKLGRLLDEAWKNKKKSNPNASNEFIDEIYSLAIKNGALGGKVMGAGGGGHMYFFAEPETHRQIKEALSGIGARFIDFDFDFDGLKVYES